MLLAREVHYVLDATAQNLKKITMPCADKKCNLKGKIETMSNTKQTWQSSTCKHLRVWCKLQKHQMPIMLPIKQACAMYYTNQIPRLQLIRTKIKRTNNQISSNSVNWKLISDKEEIKRYEEEIKRYKDKKKIKC